MIKDGGGRAFLAKVSSQQRLLVESKSRSSEEVEAQNGQSFVLHGECHLAAAASGGLMSLANSETLFNVFITRIHIDVHTLTPVDLVVTQVKNPTISNGTDISTTGIVNKNYASGVVLAGTLTISDGSSNMTYTGGSQYHAFPVQTMQQYIRDMQGTNIVNPDTIILWGWKTRSGSNATDAEIISLSVNCVRVKID